MSEVTPSELDPHVLQKVVEYHAQVEEARRDFEDAKERLKTRKNRLEALQESFETAFRRLISKRGDLPLFANQSEVIDKANNDPVVSALVDRLLGYGHDVNTLLVAGYTEDERREVVAYLDAADARGEGEEMPDPPAFLEPRLTPLEIAGLMTRLADAGLRCEEDEIAGWGAGSLHEVRTWLDACDAVKAEKGEALVVDDLPTMPDWLSAHEDADVPEDDDGDDEEAADADEAEDADEGDLGE